jgi:hypothetical protein
LFPKEIFSAPEELFCILVGDELHRIAIRKPDIAGVFKGESNITRRSLCEKERHDFERPPRRYTFSLWVLPHPIANVETKSFEEPPNDKTSLFFNFAARCDFRRFLSLKVPLREIPVSCIVMEEEILTVWLIGPRTPRAAQRGLGRTMDAKDDRSGGFLYGHGLEIMNHGAWNMEQR